MLVEVTEDGCPLRYAAENFCVDREIVIAAVTQRGYALYYAAERFQLDRRSFWQL